MTERNRRMTFFCLALAVVAALALGACSDDDDEADNGGASSSEQDSDDGGASTPSGSDDNLLVPRDYLQGEWCDSDGASWTIEDDTATLDDGSGGTGTFPIAILFLDGPTETLVSQSDDEFVVDFDGDEITFTRGSC